MSWMSRARMERNVQRDAVLLAAARTAKCHCDFAVCAETGGTMSVYISQDGIAAWAAGLSARVRLLGNSQENRPSCISCRFQGTMYCGGVVSIGCIHPSTVQCSVCDFWYLAAFSLRGARVFHNALMHALARLLTKDISMTLATFPNVLFSRTLCGFRLG